MAAGKHGSAEVSILLVDGYNLISAKPQTLQHKVTALLEPSHGLGDTTEAMTPTGLSKAELSQTGAFFDDTTNLMHTLLSPAGSGAVVRIIVWGYAGNAIGGRFTGAEASYVQSYDVIGQIGKLTKANAAYTISGVIDYGQIIQSLTQKTVSWNTKTDGFSVDYRALANRSTPITSSAISNPGLITTPTPHGFPVGAGSVGLIAGHSGSTPSINGGVQITGVTPTTFTLDAVNITVGGTGGTVTADNSMNGADGYLEVTEMTGPTLFVGKIRSSADDTTYADLITFSNVTAAPTAQRVTVSGTIARYLSFSGTVTGAGTITVFAGLARN